MSDLQSGVWHTYDMQRFADRMVSVLEAKRKLYGDSWRDMDPRDMLHRLEAELGELMVAMNAYIEFGMASPDDIMDECVDVANVALFLYNMFAGGVSYE